MMTLPVQKGRSLDALPMIVSREAWHIFLPD